MNTFFKQLLFIVVGVVVIATGVLVIRGANIRIPQGYNQTGAGAPIAWWKMDEASWNGTAGEVIDATGNGNNGTSTNGANTTSTAVFGRAGSFDGSNDYILFSLSNTPLANSQKTICAWIKRGTTGRADAISTSRLIEGGVNNEAKGYGFLVGNTNLLTYYHTAVGELKSTNTINTNWHFVCVTTDTNGSNGKLYIDGVQETLSVNTLAVASAENSAGYGAIGRISQSAGNWMLGLIDDVRIYDYALTADQVRQIYNETAHLKIVGGYQQTGAGKPIAWWKMDEASWNGTAGEVIDATGNGNNGTSTNGANTTSTAVFGRAGSFTSASSQYVNGQVQLVSSYPFTMSAWVKTSLVDTTQAIFQIQDKDVANVQYGIFIHSASGPNKAIVRARNTTVRDAVSITTVADGNWHFVTGVFTSDTSRSIYIDGKFEAESVAEAFYSSDVDSWDVGRFGDSTPDGYFNGLIDDTRIYDYALTADQVRQIYNETAKVKMSTGLVGWWKMDDNADNTTVRDYSRYANNGTFSDATGNPFTSAHTTTTAQIGRAMVFDGVNDYVEVPYKAVLESPSDVTLSAWAKSNIIGSDYIVNGFIIDMGNVANTGYGIYLQATTNKIVGYYHSVYATADDTLDTNWHYYTYTYNGINLYLYVDGVRQADTETPTPTDITDYPLRIGCYSKGTASFWNGLIDDVRIYNYARTAEQIKQDYERGLLGRE